MSVAIVKGQTSSRTCVREEFSQAHLLAFGLGWRYIDIKSAVIRPLFCSSCSKVYEHQKGLRHFVDIPILAVLNERARIICALLSRGAEVFATTSAIIDKNSQHSQVATVYVKSFVVGGREDELQMALRFDNRCSKNYGPSSAPRTKKPGPGRTGKAQCSSAVEFSQYMCHIQSHADCSVSLCLVAMVIMLDELCIYTSSLTDTQNHLILSFCSAGLL
jgi:hypothetical protein